MSAPPLRVKVCGVRTLEGAQAAVDAGADFLGFILYPLARRYVPPERVAVILRQLRGRSTVQAVGVFVNQAPAHLNAVADASGLDLLQLSGDEPPDFVGALHRPAIKALRMDGSGSLPELDRYQLFAALLEPPAAGWGGSGVGLDWVLARRVTARVDRPPVFLAGGLDAANVAQAIRAVGPDGVDASSGVERAGVQDPERIAAFVAAARGAVV